MYVCICRAVTDSEVRECIANGACTVRDVVRGCAAGTGCGSCVGTIAALLSAYANGTQANGTHAKKWDNPLRSRV